MKKEEAAVKQANAERDADLERIRNDELKEKLRVAEEVKARAEATRKVQAARIRKLGMWYTSCLILM